MAKPRVEIEWPDDLTFGSDVTSDIIGEIECWRGRSYHHPHYRSQGVGVAGHCTFVLRNDGGRYNIDDDDDAPIGAKVQVSLQVGASTWRVMWTGYIDSYDYQYRRQGYDRIAVRALGRMAQLETATWSIAGADPDPRAYDVINDIVEGVTGEGVESNYNVSGNKDLEPPGGGANEGSRNWSVRLQNFRIEEAPALQTIRDAATISFAHVYETASGKLRIQGLPARQSKIDGSAEMTFRDTSGTGVRVHDYEVSLKTERIANAAARSILDKFEPVDNEVQAVANGSGTRTLRPTGRSNGVPNRQEFLVLSIYRGTGGVRTTTRVSGGAGTNHAFRYPGSDDHRYEVFVNGSYWRPVLAPYPGGLTFNFHFTPQSYLFEDPNGVLAPVLTTPDPYTETVSLPANYTRARARVPWSASITNSIDRQIQWYPSNPAATHSNTGRVQLHQGLPETGDGNESSSYFYHDFLANPLQWRWVNWRFEINLDADAPSNATWSWDVQYMPLAATSSDKVIAQNDSSITKYGRRGYAVPGIYWGPDLDTGDDNVLDIRSFVGYIVRDEFLGKPGYYGTIVVDLTRQFYPTTGATNPELDVGDKITLYQGTNSRDYLVSAIRYRFRQGEQLRAQIECAPARVM